MKCLYESILAVVDTELAPTYKLTTKKYINMKSLYESILDADDTKLDKNGIKIILNDYGITTKGSGKNTVVTSSIFLYQNSKGEVIPHTYDTKDIPLDDVVSLSTLFPDGATLANVKYHSFNEKGACPSALPKNIKIQKFEISAQDHLDMLDAEVGSVDITDIDYDLLNDSTFETISSYTDTLYITPPTDRCYWLECEEFIDMKNCPLKNIIWRYGARAFGLDKSKNQTIKQYIDSNGQKSEFAQKVKKWLENNPKTNLIISWGKVIFEKMTIEGDKLVATKISNPEINKLVK